MAARDFIKVDRFTPAATHMNLLLQYVAAVRQSYELSKRIAGIIDHNNDGTNFADVETLFGIPAGSGAAAVTLINAAVNESNSKALTERIG